MLLLFVVMFGLMYVVCCLLCDCVLLFVDVVFYWLSLMVVDCCCDVRGVRVGASATLVVFVVFVLLLL